MSPADRAVDSTGRCRIKDNTCSTSRPWLAYEQPAQMAAERTVLSHLVADLPDLSDAALHELAAEHAYETGHYAVEARRLIDAEFESRRERAALVAAMCPPTYWTATPGSTR
ncbi:hypothetical protein [Micromonospora tulbaghiae]|uniref:hypothetical protein n=1 Tax=Micromonospora tulbaghiae TaxID=479978 RepID=UPI0033D61A58